MEVNRNSDSFIGDNPEMSIGKRVREARKDLGLTQAELAKKVGIAQATISELESGESSGTGYVATMASVLGVNPLWLESGKGPRKASGASTPNRPSVSYVVPPEELADVIALYTSLPPELRQQAMDFLQVSAQRAAKADQE